MAKRKNFRTWYEEDEWGEDKERHSTHKKDSKRYDRKKAKIQNARKQKARQKNSYFS